MGIGYARKIKAWLWLLSHKAVPVVMWTRLVVSYVVARLAVSYVDMLWNQSLTVFRIIQRRLAFGVEDFESWQPVV